MEETKELTLTDDVVEQLALSSANLEVLEKGTKERQIEAGIYNNQLEQIMKIDEFNHKRDLDLQKAELQREIEEAKLKIEESKAKNEKWSLWARVGIAATTGVAEIALGVLYLKANLAYGGMMGKDGQSWFKELKKIRL